MKKLIVLFLSFFLVNLGYSQEPVSIHLTEKDGVPSTSFFDVIEDDNGYIWLDSDKGIYRYNGSNYLNFQHKDQRGLSIFQVKKAVDNTIWYLNLSGQIFYILNNKVHLFKDLKEVFKGRLPTLNIYKKNLILFTESIILIYNIDTKKEIYKNISEKNIFNIEPTIFNDNLYYGETTNLIQLNLNNFKQKHQSFNTKHNLVNSSKLIFINNEGVILLRKKFGYTAYKLFPNFELQPEKINHSLPNIQITKVKIINNQIWYCSKNGVYICSLTNNNELIIDRHLFSNTFITDVIVDKDQNYWFTTINKSIFIIPNIEINSIDIPLGDTFITKTNIGKSDELLIVTNGVKVIQYNTNTSKSKSVTFKDNNKVKFATFNSFTKEYYISTDINLFLFNHNFIKKNEYEPLGTIKKVSFINENEALAMYSSAIRIIEFPDKNKFSLGKRGYSIHYDSKNDLRYFATVDGLFVLDKNLKKTTILYNEKPLFVTSITQTENGIVWCATFKNGIFSIKNNKITNHYTNQNGLLSNINSHIKSDKNTIWITGNKGVQKFNTLTKKIQNITKNEGVVSYNYNGLEIIDDNIYLSTPKQIIFFNKEKVFKPYNTTEVHFTDITLNNTPQPLAKKYIFPYNNSNIKIEFNAIGFSAKDKARFKYRLIGYDNNWTSTKSGKNYVQFNTLSSGKYTLQVQNIISGKSNVITKEIQLIVTKPFWMKFWFISLITLLFFTSFGLYFWQKNRKEKIKRLKKLDKLKIEKQLVNLKLENFRAQLNPHFIFNALNSIHEFILTNNKNLAGDYLSKFSNLIRTYLDQSLKNKITLSEEIETLNQYLDLEKIRFEDDFEFNLEVTSHIDPSEIMLPTMLIQPYIENAIKHGLLHKKGIGKLSVKFIKENSAIICKIKDNGVGREKVKIIQNKGIMSINSFDTSENRLKLINHQKKAKIKVIINDLYDEHQSIGTEVVIIIPQ